MSMESQAAAWLFLRRSRKIGSGKKRFCAPKRGSPPFGRAEGRALQSADCIRKRPLREPGLPAAQWGQGRLGRGFGSPAGGPLKYKQAAEFCALPACFFCPKSRAKPAVSNCKQSVNNREKFRIFPAHPAQNVNKFAKTRIFPGFRGKKC